MHEKLSRGLFEGLMISSLLLSVFGSLSWFHFTDSLPVEEIEQMNNLFQQKQRELVMAATKVEELNRQLELLKTSKMENFNDNQSSVAELDRLYKELQVCKKEIF